MRSSLVKTIVRLWLATGLALLCAISLVRAAAYACDSLLDAGDSLYATFNNTEALSAYRKAYAQCPRSYEALMKYTRTLNDVGEDIRDDTYYDKAMHYADTMQEQYPDSMQSYFLKAAAAGNLAENSGGTKRVRLSRIVDANARAAIRLDSSYAPAHVILGAYYTRVAGANPFLKHIANIVLGGVPNGTYEDALRELRYALSLDSTNMYAHLEIAKAYLEMDSTDAARRHLERVRELPLSNHQHPRLKQEATHLLHTLEGTSALGVKARRLACAAFPSFAKRFLLFAKAVPYGYVALL